MRDSADKDGGRPCRDGGSPSPTLRHPLFAYSPDVASLRPPAEVTAFLVFHGVARGGHRDVPAWCLDLGEAWREADGDRMPKSEHDVVAESRVVLNGAWESLPWAGTAIVRPEAESGWLSPEADWTGCTPVWHERVAVLVLKREPEELHRTFARVRGRGFTSPPTSTGRLTPAQSRWLRSHGFCAGDEEAGRASGREEAQRSAAAAGRPLRRSRADDTGG